VQVAAGASLFHIFEQLVWQLQMQTLYICISQCNIMCSFAGKKDKVKNRNQSKTYQRILLQDPR
jgi:hypothetical protein